MGLSDQHGIAIVGGLVFGLGFGYLTWYFTRYVIDGTELRITSGVLTKSSRRIPYERIQSVDIAEPLVARLFGLAELRIEMAGGSDSRTTLAIPAAGRRAGAAPRAAGSGARPGRRGVRTRRAAVADHPGAAAAHHHRHPAVAGLRLRGRRPDHRGGRRDLVRPVPRRARRTAPVRLGDPADRHEAGDRAVGLPALPRRARPAHRARAAVPHVADHPVRPRAGHRGQGAVRVAPIRLAAARGRHRRLRRPRRRRRAVARRRPCCPSPIRRWPRRSSPS